MNGEDDPLVPSEKDIKSKMEDVKELYKNVERFHGGFSEPGDGAEKFSGKPSDPGQGTGASRSVGVNAAPRWVLEVLSDISHLAENEGWIELHTCLQDATLSISQVLDRMDQRVDFGPGTDDEDLYE
ncbi:MAG: hypothetical protein AB8B62_00300 [Roseobacter sp.]